MKITAISLQNVRGFQSLPKTEFSDNINLLVGHNNAGKSTILNCILELQYPNSLKIEDVTIGQVVSKSKITLSYENLPQILMAGAYSAGILQFDCNTAPGSSQKRIVHNTGNPINFAQCNREPHNIIYPFLSKRKVAAFSEDVKEANTNAVTQQLSNLYAKIDRLSNTEFQPANQQYISACDDILGFRISAVSSPGGKQAAYTVYNLEHIPLKSMGEGVSNILGLIVDLCIAEDKIFIIEEPENDIHPKALKALLELIIEKSATNQFFISTHSNIVMKMLGAVKDAKIFHVEKQKNSVPDRPKLFLSTMMPVPNTPEAKRAVLEDLGYEFNDFGLWESWLFLEESSAEEFIRTYFLKWFTPSLVGKLRTFSARSVDEVIPKFEDFNNLFVFLHLTPTYINKVWVIVDAGENEKEVIDKLKAAYVKNGWNDSNFSQFSEHEFESYYPQAFQDKFKIALAAAEALKTSKEIKQAKRQAKSDLLNEVKAWIKEDEERAKVEFGKSAAPVIAKLQEIEAALGLS